MAEKKTVLAKARAWATKKKLFGAQAFFRYVILSFTENLNQVTNDFVFKGGNLLWVYIGTPRATIDLDLTTLESNSHKVVRKMLDKACAIQSEIQFSVTFFKEIEQANKSGCVVTITYKSDQGASNSFDVDIVYAVQTESCEIDSPINTDRKIRSATVENIIADKLAACHLYRSGNTRMKDYDDLWRLSQSTVTINRTSLSRLCDSRKISLKLDRRWISTNIESAWASHQKRYPDLPKNLEALFNDVNLWLED